MAGTDNGFIDRNTYCYKLGEDGEPQLIKTLPPPTCADIEVFNESAIAGLNAKGNTRKPRAFNLICRYCGKEFVSRYPRAVFCNPIHQVAFHKEQGNAKQMAKKHGGGGDAQEGL